MKKVTRRALRGHFHSPVVPAGHGNLRRIRDPSARGHEVRILRLRSQARFAQDDTALRERVRTFRNPTTKLRTALGPGRPFMSRGCGLATITTLVGTRCAGVVRRNCGMSVTAPAVSPPPSGRPPESNLAP